MSPIHVFRRHHDAHQCHHDPRTATAWRRKRATSRNVGRRSPSLEPKHDHVGVSCASSWPLNFRPLNLIMHGSTSKVLDKALWARTTGCVAIVSLSQCYYLSGDLHLRFSIRIHSIRIWGAPLRTLRPTRGTDHIGATPGMIRPSSEVPTAGRVPGPDGTGGRRRPGRSPTASQLHSPEVVTDS